MKDVKFVVLLLLIVFVGIVNIVWLATLQVKFSRLSISAPSQPKSNSIPDSNFVDKLFVEDLSVGMLRIFDEKSRCRIMLRANGDDASISILDTDNRLRFYSWAGDDTAILAMPLPPINISASFLPGILLSTRDGSDIPYFEMQDNLGGRMGYSSVGPIPLSPEETVSPIESGHFSGIVDKDKANRPQISWEITDISTKITERNSTYWQFAWRVTVKNNHSCAINLSGEIEFQDTEGFIVDTDGVYNIIVPANSSKTFTGADMVSTSIAPKIANTVVKLR